MEAEANWGLWRPGREQELGEAGNYVAETLAHAAA